MFLAQETVIKEYMKNGTAVINELKQYYYDNEEEKIEHSKEMKAEGYEDSLQLMKNLGTIEKPEYVWFGSYYRSRNIFV